MSTFLFTCGDPNGIGPEIIVKALGRVYNRKDKFIVPIPKSALQTYLKSTNTNLELEFIDPKSDFTKLSSGRIYCVDIPGAKLSVGKPTKSSGKISFNSLNTAIEILRENSDSALITAPISKDAWRMNNISFEGHTDLLGKEFQVKEPLMLFYSPNMIAGLTTIHKPIKSISKLLSIKRLEDIINSLFKSLSEDFKIKNPKIAVLGLNPHAGENGKIGSEEINVIKPVIDRFDKNIVYGPFVPDAFFGKKLFKNFDAVLGMYHDQVLIPFKMLDFYRGVNFTANLPIVRTSPDHGTAFDIAGKNSANPLSIIEAFKLAKKVLVHRR